MDVKPPSPNREYSLAAVNTQVYDPHCRGPTRLRHSAVSGDTAAGVTNTA